MTYSIRVIGGWQLLTSDGEARNVRQPIARLLAFLALRGGIQQRSLVAGSLWPDGCDHRAGSNLRSTIWHARTEIPGVVDGDSSTVWLCDNVDVDFVRAMGAIRSLLAGHSATPAAFAMLLDDVLPDWDEDWVRPIRFVHRQLRLQALDRLLTIDSCEHAAGLAS